MNTQTPDPRKKIESLGFNVDVNHDTEWDTYKVVVDLHGNPWASVERHDLQQAMVESLYIIKRGVYGKML